MNYNFEELGKLLSEYFENIQNQFKEKLKSQNNEFFKTNRGDYEIIKIEQINLDDLNIENEKIHHLFSQNGCIISGTILVKAQAYTPQSDRNGFTSHIFEIGFKPITIKFSFEKEAFPIEEDIAITFINVSDKKYL